MHPAFEVVSGTATLADLRQAARQAPQSAEAAYALGLALAERAELPEALAYLRRACSLQPRQAPYHVGLGQTLYRLSAIDEAMDSFQAAHAIDAGSRAAEWLAYLTGEVRGRFAASREFCRDAVHAAPNSGAAYVFLGLSWLEGESAASALAQACATLAAPARLDVLEYGIGVGLLHLGRYEEARAYLEHRTQGASPTSRMLALLGRVAHALGDVDPARACFARIRHDLRDPAACDDYLRFAWRTGDYAGVKEMLLRDCRQPVSAADGPHILLSVAGNGYGDEIQWAGVAPVLAAQGAHVLLECRTPVRRLLATMSGIEGVVVRHDPYPSHYERFPFFKLLSAIEWNPDALGTRIPYLHVPAALAASWRATVERCGRGFHVGVEWRASLADAGEARDPYTNRSMPVELLAELTRVPGVVWHALHVGKTGLADLARRAPEVPIHPLSREIDDFLDTAAAISAVDAVVTIDSAVAHLAGALGKPVLLLLPAVATWRWGDPGCRCLWYPSVQRFWQARPGDWRSAIAQAVSALRPLAAAARPLHGVCS
jgi:Tfp pilus assembly protein PilF